MRGELIIEKKFRELLQGLAQTGGALHTMNPVHIIKADGKGTVVHRMGPRGEIQGSIKIVFLIKDT